MSLSELTRQARQQELLARALTNTHKLTSSGQCSNLTTNQPPSEREWNVQFNYNSSASFTCASLCVCNSLELLLSLALNEREKERKWNIISFGAKGEGTKSRGNLHTYLAWREKKAQRERERFVQPATSSALGLIRLHLLCLLYVCGVFIRLKGK